MPIPDSQVNGSEKDYLERRTIICNTYNFLKLMFSEILTESETVEGNHVLRVSLKGNDQMRRTPQVFRHFLEQGVKVIEIALPRTVKTIGTKRKGFLIFLKVATANDCTIVEDCFEETRLSFKVDIVKASDIRNDIVPFKPQEKNIKQQTSENTNKRQQKFSIPVNQVSQARDQRGAGFSVKSKLPFRE
eukprot:UN30002